MENIVDQELSTKPSTCMFSVNVLYFYYFMLNF